MRRGNPKNYENRALGKYIKLKTFQCRKIIKCKNSNKLVSEKKKKQISQE